MPNLTERNRFFKWFEQEISAIDVGKPSRLWQVQKFNYSNIVLYSASYTIHVPIDKDDIAAKYLLIIKSPSDTGKLEVSIFSYGGLNLDAITSNVENGIVQLEKSASRELDPEIPRIIVLAFESGIGFEQEVLSSHITWLLENHSGLSALAILEWAPDGMPLPTIVPRFLVYHNSKLQGVKPLPVDAFKDKWSIQI